MSMDEAAQRHAATVTEWEARGHPKAPCSGHVYALPHCPAPDVHARIFPPEDALTLDRVLGALRAVFENLDSTGRAGDEWAYEWVHEVWPVLVPDVVRRAVGDPEAGEDR